METHKITPTGEKEIEVKIGQYRLVNAVKITALNSVGAEYIPAREELAIEAETKDGHYYVIAWVKWNDDERDTELTTVGERVLDKTVTMTDWANFAAIYRMAVQFIQAQHINDEDD